MGWRRLWQNSDEFETGSFEQVQNSSDRYVHLVQRSLEPEVVRHSGVILWDSIKPYQKIWTIHRTSHQTWRQQFSEDFLHAFIAWALCVKPAEVHVNLGLCFFAESKQKAALLTETQPGATYHLFDLLLLEKLFFYL